MLGNGWDKLDSLAYLEFMAHANLGQTGARAIAKAVRGQKLGGRETRAAERLGVYAEESSARYPGGKTKTKLWTENFRQALTPVR